MPQRQNSPTALDSDALFELALATHALGRTDDAGALLGRASAAGSVLSLPDQLPRRTGFRT